MRKVNDQLNDMHVQMEKIASMEVERLAREILRKNKSLHEFIMAMGVYYFKDNKGEIVDVEISDYSVNGGYKYKVSRPSFKPLYDFIGEWNEILKITGESMRFTATSKKITDW